MIDWRSAQARLAAAGYSTGPIDGIRGMRTLRALLDFSARRPLNGDGDERATVALAQYDGFGMTEPARLAEFLAQVTHETGDFTRNVENLNYTSAAQILATWPSRFRDIDDAARFVRNPIALANRVYARPNEGNTEPGDGWKYRGRGDLEITFKNGYALMGQAIGRDLVSDPDLAAQPGLSHRIALECWRRFKVNDWIDRGDFYAARALTNCGSPHPASKPIGLDDVASRRARLLFVLE